MDFCVGICWDMLGYAGIMSEKFWGRNMQKGMNMKTSDIWLIFLLDYFRGQSGTCEVCLFFCLIVYIVCRISSVLKK